MKNKLDFFTGGNKMTGYAQRTKEELQQLKKELEKQYEDAKGKGLKLDMSRGKPSAAQLDLSMGIMDVSPARVS